MTLVELINAIIIDLNKLACFSTKTEELTASERICTYLRKEKINLLAESKK
jgi:hypothetical protein